ncbi:molybdate ABC transporter substrate-binding protein [Dongshaea marina]|uniref:molybdate ABC transporter substrate-binding protein n=1 Tax=Dongshaea marina TaxID=2047966 RepID=UPI000D3ED748|nr:molybdate ABC transporter substrate-binding protein [Dongshaea marina]
MKTKMLFKGIGIALLLTCGAASADTVHVAVAANFRTTMEKIAQQFTAKTGDKVTVSSASTGILYSQIQHGAPFDLFLAADARRPELLEKQGKIVPNSRFTYATGLLALWSPKQKADRALLNHWQQKIALANPKTAPYGLAAKQSLEKMKLWGSVAPHAVYGNNITQTYQFVSSGNVQLGFVAYSELVTKHQQANAWIVPATLHAPLEQQAVLLKHAQNNNAAKALYQYLRNDAKTMIEKAGYQLPAHA